MLDVIEPERLAYALHSVQSMDPNSFSMDWLARMDEQVLMLLDTYPYLREAHGTFAQARGGVWPHSLSAETWAAMEQAAATLAAQVGKLCNVRIPLCELPTKYGGEVCYNALTANGECLRDWHIDPMAAEDTDVTDEPPSTD